MSKMYGLVELSHLNSCDSIRKIIVPICAFTLVEGPDDDAIIMSNYTAKPLFPDDVYIEEGYKEIKELMRLATAVTMSLKD